jgi:thiol-disulfide isomerase/thioredoxin
MNLRLLFILLILTFVQVDKSFAQRVKQIDIPELEQLLKSDEDRLHVVNFWATWCPPCVKEMPYFRDVALSYNDKKVKFLFVSLDFPSQLESNLIPFLDKYEIYLDVFLMMNTDYNEWIDKVDPAWQGNIPVTIFYNNVKKKRYFHPGELSEQELRKIINSMI